MKCYSCKNCMIIEYEEKYKSFICEITRGMVMKKNEKDEDLILLYNRILECNKFEHYK